MSRNKSTERRRAQRTRKRERNAHLSPEILKSFKAINQWIDRQSQSNKVKKQVASTKVRANRRKLIRLSESQNHRCCYCGCDTWHPEIIDYQINRSESNRATLEHLLPNAQGGTFRWENLAMACSECNTARGDMLIEEFLASIYQPDSNREKKKEQTITKDRRLKEEKSTRNRFRLFMIALWILPIDYQHVMENLNKHDVRTVFKGGRKPTKPRRHLMKNIRRRVIENRMAA